MTAIRVSNKLVQYSATLLYTVPTNKFATLSVAFQRPIKAGLFLHTGADIAPFALTTSTVYTPTHPDMGKFTIPGNTSISKIKATATAYVDITTATANIGFRYGVGSLDPLSAFTELRNTSYYTKSIPVLDYQADPNLANGMYYFSGSTWRFARGTNMAFLYGPWTEANLGYTAQGNYYNAGGAIYGTSAVCMDTNGNASWWYTNIATSISGTGAQANTTSETSTYSCYWIATGNSRTIVPGSPQIMIDNGTPYIWCSSWASGARPLMARIPWTNLQASNYNGWDTINSQSFTGYVNGEKLFWCRRAAGYLYVGSSTDSIYTSTTFNSAFTKITAPNADVDVQTPPIRDSVNTLIFRSKVGSGYWVMTGGGTPTWSNVTDLATIYAYTENPALTSTIAADGIVPIASSSIGYRNTDLRLYTNTTYKDVINGYSTRDPASDIVQGLSRNAERTNLLLKAGDKIYGYSESSDTVVHTYGFEEFQ